MSKEIPSATDADKLPPPEPRSRAKTIGCALFIILSIGGVGLAGAGAAGYFHVGVLSQLKQVDALIMIAAGGGAAIFGAMCAGIIKSRSKRESPKKTAPKLPHILDLTLDKSHPLQQSMENDEHLNAKLEETFRTQLKLNDQDIKKISRCQLKDQFGRIDPCFVKLFEMPLYSYLHPDQEVNKLLQEPKLKDLLSVIDARIEQFDKLMNLKKRIDQLENKELTIENLIESWEDSRLRWDLILDDEPLTDEALSKTSINTIYRYCDNFTDDQWRIVRMHNRTDAIDFSKIKKEKWQKVFDIFYNEDLRFTSIRSLEPAAIYQLQCCFSKSHWGMVSENQILNLEFDKIEKGRRGMAINAIFVGAYEDLVNKLPSRQQDIVKKYLKSEKPAPSQESKQSAGSSPHKPESETPKQAPHFPKLLDLKLEASSPLLEPLAEDLFSNRAYLASKYDFLNIPLSFMINPVIDGSSANEYMTLITLPDNADLVNIVNKRIEELDKAIQLKGRIKELSNNKLFIRDLLPAWSDSYIKLALMMDDELSSITVSSIETVDTRQLDSIVPRIKKLNSQRQTSTPTNTQFEELLLVDVCNLSAAQIDSSPKPFPLISLSLIDEGELHKIDASKWTSQQTKVIFSYYIQDEYNALFWTPGDYFVEKLKQSQISQCANLIEDFKLFENLSNSQILELDFSIFDGQKRQEVFDSIFSTTHGLSSMKANLFNQFPLEKIYGLSQYFSKDHWENLSREQTIAFDFSKIDADKRQEAFDILFSTEFYRNKAVWLALLPLEKIHELSQYFSKRHWEYLSEQQTIAFDFSKIDAGMRQVVCANLFSTTDGYPTKRANLLARLSHEKIHELSQYFSKRHWEYLSEEQTVAFDFSRLDAVKRQVVFNILFSTTSGYPTIKAKLLVYLPLEKIYGLSQHFSSDHWKFLSREQTIAFDFSRIDADKRQEVFNFLFSTTYGYPTKRAKLLAQLPLETIYGLSQYLSKDHWKYLTNEQAAALNSQNSAK